MSYSLSFSNDFYFSDQDYGNWNITKQEPATNCMDALIQMYKYQRESFIEMIRDVFNNELATWMTIHKALPDNVIFELIAKIKEINTCSNLSSPVEVWISRAEFGPGWTIDIN